MELGSYAVGGRIEKLLGVYPPVKSGIEAGWEQLCGKAQEKVNTLKQKGEEIENALERAKEVPDNHEQYERLTQLLSQIRQWQTEYGLEDKAFANTVKAAASCLNPQQHLDSRSGRRFSEAVVRRYGKLVDGKKPRERFRKDLVSNGVTFLDLVFIQTARLACHQYDRQTDEADLNTLYREITVGEKSDLNKWIRGQLAEVSKQMAEIEAAVKKEATRLHEKIEAEKKEKADKAKAGKTKQGQEKDRTAVQPSSDIGQIAGVPFHEPQFGTGLGMAQYHCPKKGGKAAAAFAASKRAKLLGA
jgi:hypothetical protein